MKQEFGEFPPGSVTLSTATWLFVRRYDEASASWRASPPAPLAMQLVALDALLQALFSHEKVYANGYPEQDDNFITGHPEIPGEFLSIRPAGQRVDQLLVRELLSSPAYERLIADYERYYYQAVQPRVGDPYHAEAVLRTYQRFSHLGLYPEYQPGSPDEYIPEDVLVKGKLALRAELTANEVAGSAGLGMPFFASQVESPVCIFEHLEERRRREGVASQWAVDRLRETWYSKARKANNLKSTGFLTLKVPFFLLLVLSECQTPEDLFPVAMQMREEKEAKAFRKWTAGLDAETDVDKLTRELADVEQLLDTLDNRLSRPSRIGSILKGISIGFPWGVSIGADAIAEAGRGLGGRRGQLRFLNKVWRAASQNGQLEHHLSRVYSVERNGAAKEVVALIDALPGAVAN